MPRLTQVTILRIPIQGYHLLWPSFPERSSYKRIMHWPSPLSLVTTNGVSVDFLSSRYLDISVPWVRFRIADTKHKLSGFTHSEIRASQVISTSTRLIAAYYVFHRLLPPRYPPNALNILIIADLSRTELRLHKLNDFILSSVICVFYFSNIFRSFYRTQLDV